MKAKLIASTTICGLVLVALLTGQSSRTGPNADEHIVRAPAMPDATASQHDGEPIPSVSTCEPTDAQGN